MIVRRLLLVCCLLPVLASAGPSGMRLWQFTSGQTVTAQYRWADHTTLYLEDARGKVLKFPVGLLSNPDLELVRTIREDLRKQGILFEAPLTRKSFRSKNLKPLDAERAGVYPVDSRDNTMGTLELEFSRFGVAPVPGPGQTAVLRLSTANQRDAGTNSTVRVRFQGKTVGVASQITPASTFDIPLLPQVFAGEGSINVTITGGRDTILLRSGKSGAGPRLLILDKRLAE